MNVAARVNNKDCRFMTYSFGAISVGEPGRFLLQLIFNIVKFFTEPGSMLLLVIETFNPTSPHISPLVFGLKDGGGSGYFVLCLSKKSNAVSTASFRSSLDFPLPPVAVKHLPARSSSIDTGLPLAVLKSPRP